MVTIEEAEKLLFEAEFFINDLNIKLNSKQSERLLSNTAWLSDNIERNRKETFGKLKETIQSLSKHYSRNISTNQFDSTVILCEQIIIKIEDLNRLIKEEGSPYDISLKWKFYEPQIDEKLKSLRNRIGILRRVIAQVRISYGDAW